jgi:serine/threonine-protein kinase
MLGTVDYVAPEQIEGSEPDGRSDIYSLGCVLYEMLSGEAPFADQRGAMAKMWAQVNSEPRALSERRADLPAALEDITRRAMSKKPQERPTAAEFRTRVLRAVGEGP